MKSALAIAVLSVACLSPLWGAHIESDKLRFSISFPDSDDWAAVEYKSLSPEISLWTSTNEELGTILQLIVIDAPMPGASPTFREGAVEWEHGMMGKLMTKISSRFASLSGREAYELVTTFSKDEETYFLSNWYVQDGQTSFYLTVTTVDRDALSAPAALEFLQSFAISTKKEGEPVRPSDAG